MTDHVNKKGDQFCFALQAAKKNQYLEINSRESDKKPYLTISYKWTTPEDENKPYLPCNYK